MRYCKKGCLFHCQSNTLYQQLQRLVNSLCKKSELSPTLLTNMCCLQKLFVPSKGFARGLPITQTRLQEGCPIHIQSDSLSAIHLKEVKFKVKTQESTDRLKNYQRLISYLRFCGHTTKSLSHSHEWPVKHCFKHEIKIKWREPRLFCTNI
jgi:hypothetical protein